MEITKCYKVGNYIIIDPLQLVYLKQCYETKYGKFISEYEKIPFYFKKHYKKDFIKISKQMKAFEKAIKKGLNEKKLASLKDLKQMDWKTKYVDTVIKLKEGVFYFKEFYVFTSSYNDAYVPCSSEIEMEKIIPPVPHISKVVSVKKEEENLFLFVFETNNGKYQEKFLFKVKLERDLCWNIQEVESFKTEKPNHYVKFNHRYKKELFQQVLKQRIQLALLNLGHFTTLNLPIISNCDAKCYRI